MSLKWAGVPDRCPHGEYADKDCVHCHVTKLQAENERMREALDSIAVVASIRYDLVKEG